MKKKILIFLMGSLIFTGCFNKESSESKFIKNVEKAKSYYLSGELQIINNEDTYLYDVSVAYMKDDYFRFIFINKTNNHEQIILRDNKDVYVLTPSLNKSFKFQSDWPYNNSQSYLLQSLVSDIKNDKKKKVKTKNDETIITTIVNYSNNKKLKNQKIYLDKNSMVKKVEVYDKNGILKIKMEFDKIDLSAKYKKDYFKMNSNIKASTTTTSKQIEDIVYPMNIPKNTYLSSEDKVSKEDGERVILTFLGDSPFTIVEETVSVGNELETINMYGEPELLVDTIGALSDNSITWISNGIEYYATSKVLSEEKLLDVVKSISVIPVSK